MNKGKSSPPPRRSAAEIRREREADALRANLRRRKDQQRAREAPGADETRTPPDDPARDP
jgi:hypothetical protein